MGRNAVLCNSALMSVPLWERRAVTCGGGEKFIELIREHGIVNSAGEGT